MIVRAIVGDKDAGEEALGDVTNPKSGRDFKLVKKMNGEYPNYDLSKFLDSSALGEPDEINTWLENLHDLQAIRVVKTEDELKHALKVHLGLVEEAAQSDDSYDPSEFTSKPSAKSSSSNKPTSSADLGLETASSTVVEEEVMADDEFLKEIDDL